MLVLLNTLVVISLCRSVLAFVKIHGVDHFATRICVRSIHPCTNHAAAMVYVNRSVMKILNARVIKDTAVSIVKTRVMESARVVVVFFLMVVQVVLGMRFMLFNVVTMVVVIIPALLTRFHRQCALISQEATKAILIFQNVSPKTTAGMRQSTIAPLVLAALEIHDLTALRAIQRAAESVLRVSVFVVSTPVLRRLSLPRPPLLRHQCCHRPTMDYCHHHPHQHRKQFHLRQRTAVAMYTARTVHHRH